MIELTASEVWTSPDHKSHLYWADSFEFMDSLADDSIDCIWTDPPYLLSNDGITCVAGRMVKVNKGEWDRSQGIEMDHQFNRGWLEKCFRILKPSGTIWVSGTMHNTFSVGMGMQQIGFRILNTITWEKTNPPPNLACRYFTHSTEFIIWATKGKKGSSDRYTFNYHEMKAENGDKQMKDVWRMPSITREEKKFGKHPTQKPLRLVDRCLRASTNPGDVVFDPFSGSATTGVAAITIGRHFIGCERESDFVEIAINRLSDASEKSNVEHV
jgi:site-specific DNA-methyltransferase (adenine-specific)